MMVKFVGIKEVGGIIPATQLTEEYDKIPMGAYLSVTAVQPRNANFLRKFWAFMELVMENQELYVNAGDLKTDIAIATGHSRTWYSPGRDEFITEAESISFAKMTEDDFAKFYDDIVRFVNEKIVPQLGDQVRDEIGRF
jgi:hypothetical protein